VRSRLLKLFLAAGSLLSCSAPDAATTNREPAAPGAAPSISLAGPGVVRFSNVPNMAEIRRERRQGERIVVDGLSTVTQILRDERR